MADKIARYISREFLRKKIGGRDGLYQFLEYYSVGVSKWEDDFKGDTLDGKYQSTASGTGAVAAATNDGAENGECRLVTGTDNGGRSDLSLGRHYYGQNNAIIAVRLKVSAITSVKIEVGFTDVISGTDAGAVATKATPTFNATDCAVWILDTTNNANWEGVATPTGDTNPATTVAAGRAPVAATFETMMVALVDNVVYYMAFDANDNLNYGPTAQTGGPSSDVLLTPWVFVQARNTTSKNLDIDYMRVWQRRTRSG